MSKIWRNLDCETLAIPEDIQLRKDCITVEDGYKHVQNGQIFYQEALPPMSVKTSPISVLLLHGRMFSSKTWLDLGTINLLAAMGYHTVAVDLPGYAKSPEFKVTDKAAFLHAVIQSFGLRHPVIVSPSMSGWYTIPYLLQNWRSMAGYIPVAPVGYEALEELPAAKNVQCKTLIYLPLQEFLHEPIPDLSDIQIPTMVVFGEKDRSRSSALLSLLPLSTSQEIPNGSHPAYLDNPNLWHKLLYNFLTKIEEHIFRTETA